MPMAPLGSMDVLRLQMLMVSYWGQAVASFQEDQILAKTSSGTSCLSLEGS